MDAEHDHIWPGSLELLQIPTMAFREAVEDLVILLAEDDED